MRDRRFLSAIASAAASYSLVDLVTLKTYLGVTGTQSDAAFTLWNAAASAAAQRFTNNPFVVETRYDQLWPASDGRNFEVRGAPSLFQLARWPITSTPNLSLTRPPFAPALSYAPGGSLPARVYFARSSYVTPNGETAAGLETRLVIPAGNLVTIAAPGADYYALAGSYNVYVGATSGGETQQAAGLAIDASWSEPETGLVTNGSAMPACALVAEAIGSANAAYASNGPTPLAEAVDFEIDADLGQVVRLDRNGNPRAWNAVWMSALYTAGFATIPPDVVECIAEMIKQRYFAQSRDPNVRSENIPGVFEASYWFASGPGSDTDMPPQIQAKLERYRIPAIG